MSNYKKQFTDYFYKKNGHFPDSVEEFHFYELEVWTHQQKKIDILLNAINSDCVGDSPIERLINKFTEIFKAQQEVENEK